MVTWKYLKQYLANGVASTEKFKVFRKAATSKWPSLGGREEGINHRYIFQKLWIIEVDRIMAPKDTHILNPGTCEYVTLHEKNDFADGIKLLSSYRKSILDYLGSPM